MPSVKPLLRLSNLTKRFDSPDGARPIMLLEGVSLELAAAESLAIVGPSGSGKSTLLHIIGTLDRPTSGEVWLGDRNLNELDERELATVRNHDLGFVFQFHYLLPQCTVLENVLVPTLAHKRSAQEPGNRAPEPSVERARRLLGRVGLAERLSHRPGQLSGGERQRVAVVRALINQPQLVLADEPTGALDQVAAAQLAQLLMELNREERVALIVVTHSRELARQMRRLFELRSGHLVAPPS